MNGMKLKKGLLAIIAILLVVAFYFAENKGVVTNIRKAEELARFASEDSANDPYVLTNDDIEAIPEKLEFSAFFTESQDNPYARRIKKKTIELGSKEGKELYFELNVKGNGHLENGEIRIETNNFDWQASIMGDNIVDGRYVGNIRTIKLKNEVASGNQKLFDGIATARSLNNDINNYHREDNKIILTGNYVEGDEVIPVNIVRTLTVDLRGDINTEINTRTTEYSTSKNETEMKISFKVKTEETSPKSLILKDYNFKITAPELNGYKAQQIFIDGVKVFDAEGKPENTETSGVYSKSSQVNDEGRVTKTISRKNTHNVELVYPINAYGLDTDENKLFTSVEVPVQAEYVGYANINRDATSSTAQTVIVAVEPKGFEVSGEDAFNVYVAPQNDKIISKNKAIEAYNGIETTEDEYVVQWAYYHGNKNSSGNTIMKETEADRFVSSSNFTNTNSKYYNMSDVTSNKGIYFDKETTRGFGSNAKIYVYNDDTNELIKVFKSNEIYLYNQDNPYMYENAVKHIRIKVEDIERGAYISANQIKEINDKELVQKITKEDFNKIAAVYSSLTADLEGALSITHYLGSANYEEEKSYLSLNIYDNKLDSSKLENEVTFTITVDKERYNSIGWQNGAFLIELPEDIILANIKEVKSNNENIKITAYETYQENGKNYIKVLTSNNQEEEYRLDIKVTLYVNPIAESGEKEVQLYGANEVCQNYQNTAQDIYDINSNNETDDKVGYDNHNLTIEAPNNMLTSQMASNYDEEHNVVVAPNTADVSPNQKTVDINVYVVNNYKGRVTDTQIFGTIPYEGNRYLRANSDLGSDFTTTMKDTGIQIPEELEGKVTVYYTQNTDATSDLENTDNGWETNPQDWSKVKKYLIVFENPIASGNRYQFKYTVELPEGLSYNRFSYSEHCINFAYETVDGKIPTSIEPAKLGIRTSRKYNTQITKINEENGIVVPGAIYKIAEIDNNGKERSSKLITSNKEGNLIAKGLYVNGLYTLEEVKNPRNYSLNTEKIEFTVEEKEGNTEVLEAKVLSEDKFKEDPIMDGNTLLATIEETPKYKLNITKKDKDTNQALANVRFTLSSDSKEYVTNGEGKTTIEPLEQAQKYTLKEIYSEGYYLLDDIEFKLVKQNGEFKLIRNNEIDENAQIEVSNDKDLINVNIELVNERQPQLLIRKTNAATNEPLKDVQFVVKNRAGKVYTTDNDGKVLIEGFAENTQYTLQEIKAEGFYLKEVDFEIVKDQNGKLKVESSNQEFENAVLIDEEQKILSVAMTNEQIPTYNLQITKISEGNENKKIQGAKFNLISEDEETIREYVTDENGIISVPNLYAFNSEGNITGKYSLQEIQAPNGYSNNAEIIRFKAVKNDNEDLNVQIENEDNLKTLKKAEINGNTINLVIEDKPLFTLRKVDSQTKQPLPNVEFVIMELGTLMDYAKDVNGHYVGTYDEANNRYVVKTNENGEIILPLRNGKYFAIEVKALDGYENNNLTQYFEVITGKSEENTVTEITEEENIIEIKYIEDLVAISNDSNSGNSFQGKRVVLKNDIDFNDNSSYRNWQDDSFGDLNGDGNAENIKEELTKGSGFSPIKSFYGEFDGNGKEIKNIYINGGSYVGLFDRVWYTKIYNLAISGNIAGSSYVGGIAGFNYDAEITNCYNKANIKGDCYIGGIVGGNGSYKPMENCYNSGNIEGAGYDAYIGGLIGYQFDPITINNCWNSGNITYTNTAVCYVGGLVGSWNLDSGTITNCYNEGDINYLGNTPSSNHRVGGIIGQGSSGLNIAGCYNTGNINYGKDCNMKSNTIYVGGISAEYGNITDCYNSGNINVFTGAIAECGGIIGYGNTVDNSYNTGNINCTSARRVEVAGIAGEVRYINNCYNTGNIHVIGLASEGNDSYVSSIGGYVWNAKNCYNTGNIKYESDIESHRCNIGRIVGCTAGTNNYYLDSMNFEINSKGRINLIESSQGTAQNATEMLDIKSEEYYNILNVNGLWTRIEGYEPKLLVNSADPIKAINVDIENRIRQYNISTEVEKIGVVKGGTISGDGDEFYETVRFGEANQKSIEMIPETGYQIAKITINGKTIPFEPDANGNYTLGANYFTDVQENKKVVVTYGSKETIVTINKVDQNTQEPLKGAKFDVESGLHLGELTTNSSYNWGFEEQDGKYVTTSTRPASSYMEVDLTDKKGNYNVLVNVETENSGLLKFVVTDNVNEINDGSPYNQFVYSTSKNGAATYSSQVLSGGKKYYLQLKSFSGGGVVINSVDLVKSDVIETFNNTGTDVLGTVTKKYSNKPYFEYEDGKLIPTNNNQETDLAKSYIKIDLTNKIGKYAISINAETDSANCCANVAENRDDFSTDYSSNKNFMWVNGGATAYGVTPDYPYTSKVLEGGKTYYLLLTAGSRKPENVCKINSIKLLQYTEGFKITGLETDDEGKAIFVVPDTGKYIITETQAPEGYNLLESPVEYTVENPENNTVVIENSSNKRKVTTHHYYKEPDGTYTTTKVAEDEVKEYNIGDRYETKPRFDLENLTLERSNGNYIITDEAAGEVGENNIEVNYYYETDKAELTIHHYMKNTTTKLAADENITLLPNVTIENNMVQKVDINHTYQLFENENYKNILNEYSLDSVLQDGNLVSDKEVVFNQDTELTYYYTEGMGTLRVQYLEHETERELLPEKVSTKRIGESYIAPEEEIDGFVKIITIGETQGKYTGGEIVVKFYYKQKAKVTVNHIKRETVEIEGQETVQENTLDTKTSLGLVGDKFRSSSKHFDDLVLTEKPARETVTMQPEQIQLNYYYSPVETESEKAKVIENHLDDTTGEVLYNEVHEYEIGEHYNIPAREFENYELVESKLPTNAEKDAVAGVDEVNYYYIKKTTPTPDPEPEPEPQPQPDPEPQPQPDPEPQPQPEPTKAFNLKIEKLISKIFLDGKQQTVSNGKLAKLEIHRNELDRADVVVEYTLKVSNTEEEAGYTTLVETIPEGFTMRAEDNSGWSIENNTAKLKTEILNVGEEKEYKVVLHWNKGEGNIGIKINTASLTEETNDKGIPDNNAQDNTSSATLILTISTGDLFAEIDPILGLMTIILSVASLYVAITIKK
ncbi:MAG: hypothetical protein J5881_03135 [Clostridia bacterium]|nr:hypothetical protein [Clostridia bacterium]